MAFVELAPIADDRESRDRELDAQLAGLDALEQHTAPAISKARRVFAATWPKLAAIAIAFAVWQLVVVSGWKPRYILPPPSDVLPRLWEELGNGTTWSAIGTTMRRAATGFALAVGIGVALGLAVSRWRTLRTAVGSMISGLQTMPSIAWFPLALVLFSRSDAAIYFVIVVGAAPSIANGVISGVDNIPPLFLRAGRVLGARGLSAYRYVIVPAALPAFVSGLKQGWAFSWRSLMAGELLVIIANQPSIGSRLSFEREFADYEGMMAWMLIILLIGIVLDTVVFTAAERRLLRRRGLAQ